jgi:vitamin B12 transporter
VVRTTRLPPAAGDAAFSILRIGPAQLRERPRLDEALTASPGVGLFRRTSSLGANPTTQGVSLREIAPSGAGRALVTLDGTPQNDPFGGWVIWSALPPEGLDGADLVRGAGAGPYGAGALTGVVALHSAAAEELRGQASAGDLGQRRAAVSVGASGRRIDVVATGAAEHSDGWVPVRDSRGAADTSLELNAASGSLRLQADFDGAVLAGRLAAYREAREAGLAGARSRSRGVNASLTLAQSSAAGPGWRLQGWVAASDLQNSAVAVSADRSVATPANDQYETPALGYGLNGAYRGGDGMWEVGADLRGSEGESRERFRYMSGAYTRSRVAGGEVMTAGLYAEGHRRGGGWLLTGGLRVDRWSTAQAERTERDLASGAVTLSSPAPDRSGWEPTERVGLRRDWSGLHLRTAAYAGFRPPTLNELHRPFRVGNDITEANAALTPERLYGAEVGFGGEAAALSWSVTMFRNRLQDPVTNVTIGAGPATFPVAGFVPAGGVLRQRRNAGRIDAAGLEAQARWVLGEGATLDAAATYTDARVDGGASVPQLTGLRPAQAPRLTAAVSLRLQPTRRTELVLSVRHEGSRFEDDLNSRRLGAYATLDVRAAYSLTEALQLFVAADNLADADVATGQTAEGVTAYGPPRAARFGLTLRR